MSQVTPILSFCPDPLSDVTPTYFDITSDLISAEWSDGKAKDLDEPQAGRARFVLRNTNRRLEPEFVAGAFYPNIVPLRRLKFQVVADGVTYDKGIWYAQSYEIVYPDKAANYSQVIINCVDGFGILSLDSLDFMDPPDAETYSDVADFDQPSFAYELGDPTGTKVISQMRTVRREFLTGTRAHAVGSRARYRIRVTRSAVEGVSGPSGTYKNLPTLGVPGLIIGSAETAVTFARADSQYARIPLDDADQLSKANALSIECWVQPTTIDGVAHGFVSGPIEPGSGSNLFRLYTDPNAPTFFCRLTGSVTIEAAGNNMSAGTTYHIVGTWDGRVAKLYQNGVLITTSASTTARLVTPNANEFLYIGRNTTDFANATMQHVRVYEYALSADRVLAHYNAGANRGFAQQSAGSRISTIASSDLWSEASIQAGTFQIVPRFEHGQAKLDEIAETVRAEMPDNHFYFNGTGDPVYLAWNYKDGLGAEITLGENAGEIPYTDIQPVYDDEIFNEVTTSTETGVAQMSSDATSLGAYRRRAVAETGLLLVNDSNAKNISATVLDEFKDPLFRVASVSLAGDTAPKRTAILARDIGDMIRVKRRQAGGTPMDVLTTVLGRSQAIDTSGNLWCTWTTARGFNASLAEWRLGISGFSELGTTTVLA